MADKTGMQAWADRQLGQKKQVEQAAQEEPPPDVRIADLDYLGPAAQGELAALGSDINAPGNPPRWAADKGKWERAKEAVQKYWGRYSEPYAVVAHVYERMGGTVA